MCFDTCCIGKKDELLDKSNDFLKDQMRKAYEMGIRDAQNALFTVDIENDAQERFALKAEEAISNLVND
jgi:hypothetical protein